MNSNNAPPIYFENINIPSIIFNKYMSICNTIFNTWLTQPAVIFPKFHILNIASF